MSGNVGDQEYNPDKGLPTVEATAGEGKDTGNVIGGLKASLSNDNNSEEAKKEDQARLDKLAEQGHQGFTTDADSGAGKA